MSEPRRRRAALGRPGLAAALVLALGCAGEPEPSPTRSADPAPSPDPAPDPAPEEAAPDLGAPAPPSVEGFHARWGAILRVDDVVEVEGRPSARALRAEVVGEGEAVLGLQIGWPRTVPESRTVVARPRGAARALDARADVVEVCVGDRVELVVPVEAPAPEWTDGMGSLEPGGPPEGLREVDREVLPTSVAALAPTLGDARTAAGPADTLVVYWLRARRPGVEPIALPLMFASAELEVVPAGRAVEARLDLTRAPGVAHAEASTLRVGDRVGIRYLRP